MRKPIKDRSVVILSPFHNLQVLTAEVEENNRPTGKQLSAVSKLKGGSLTTAIRDAKIMGLVKNGGGLRLTEFGKKFLLSFSNEVLKEGCLNVPAFKRYYDEHAGLPLSRNSIKRWFKTNYPNLRRAQIGCVSKRVLEGIYGMAEGEDRERHVPVIDKAEIETGNVKINFSDDVLTIHADIKNRSLSEVLAEIKKKLFD